MKKKTKKKGQEVKEELRALSPFLSQLKEKPVPFRIPEDYFEKMQQEVFSKIHSEALAPKTSEPTNIVRRFNSWISSLSWLFQPKLAVAFASVLILAVASYLAFFDESGAAMPKEFADLSTTEVSAYVDKNLDKFDDDELSENIALSEDASILPDENIGKEEINRYLDDVLDDIAPEELEDLF